MSVGCPKRGVFLFRAGYFGVFKKDGSFWTLLLLGPQRPLPSKIPPPLRTHGGLQYYSDICQSTILNEEMSINNIKSNEKRNTVYFTKTPYLKPTFNITNYTKEQQKFLTMFNFQQSQITQDEFDKLVKQLIKYSTVYATSKFDVGKISSSLNLPLKPDAVFKKQRASKVPIHLHDKVNRLLDILEQYEII